VDKFPMIRCIVNIDDFCCADEVELVALWADNTPGKDGSLSPEAWFQEMVNRKGLSGLLNIDDPPPEGLWLYEGHLVTDHGSTSEHEDECDGRFNVTRKETLTRAGAVAEALKVLPDALAIPLSQLYLEVGVIDSGSESYWAAVNRICAVDDAIRTILCVIDCD